MTIDLIMDPAEKGQAPSFDSAGGLSASARLTRAIELDRGQAERDPDPGVFGQALR